MRVGMMVRPETGRYGDKVRLLAEDAQALEDLGFTSLWVPQIPGEIDSMTTIALMGQATSRIELGTSIVPLQTRHPVTLATQALTTQDVCGGRFTLGLGPSHHWLIGDQLGLPYERPAHVTRETLQVINAMLAGPGPVDVENELFTVHSPNDVSNLEVPVLLAALAPVMLRIAGEHASGTILWMADERAVAEHVVPRITKAATDAGRPAPRVVACVPVAVCADDERDALREFTNEVLGHADFSPNYARLIEHGDAEDIGDVLASGDEASILRRLEGFRDAGVTDLAARVVPFGVDSDARRESRRRTEAFLGSLCPEL